MIKGRGQRLIPEELLKYTEALKEAHSDPTAEWGSSGSEVTLYMHEIEFVSSAGSLYAYFYREDNTPITLSTFKEKYFRAFREFPTNVEFSFNDSKLMIGVQFGANSSLYMHEINTSFLETNADVTSINDVVTQII